MVKTRGEVEEAYKKNQQKIVAELKTPIKKTTVKEWADKKYPTRKQKEEEEDKDGEEPCEIILSEEEDRYYESNEDDDSVYTEELDAEEIDRNEMFSLAMDNLALNTENKNLIKKIKECENENASLWAFIQEVKGSLLQEAKEYIKNK